MIGIYERVSHKSQNLDGQHRELEKWANAQDEPIQWFTDKASGKKMARPGFDKLWAAVERGEINRIVCWRLDRLGRTCRGLVELFDNLNERKVSLVSLKDGLDLATTTGRLIARIMASVAAYEVEVWTEKQRAGIEAKRVPVTGKCPWGGGQVGRKSKVTPEIETTIKDMNEAGKPIAEIARVLNLNRRTIYKRLGLLK